VELDDAELLEPAALVEPSDDADVELEASLDPEPELAGLSAVLFEPPDVVAEDLPRLSVLKNPLPLKVTPTGWNTFFTGMTAPVPGCVASVSVSSLNDCWTSIVSPVSTNL
jgi:hypothetical protein